MRFCYVYNVAQLRTVLVAPPETGAAINPVIGTPVCSATQTLRRKPAGEGEVIWSEGGNIRLRSGAANPSY